MAAACFSTPISRYSDHAWIAIPFLLEERAFGCLNLSYSAPQPFAPDERICRRLNSAAMFIA